MNLTTTPQLREFQIEEISHVSAREAWQLLNAGAILVDVRPEYELGRLFDVERIIYLPYKEMPDQLTELPKDKALIIADAVGLRSNGVCSMLLNNGFKNIYNLAGGIVDWERSGFPVTTDKSRILTGSCMCQLKVRSKKTK
jgi:rhodanese-related sulfurtransferase